MKVFIGFDLSGPGSLSGHGSFCWLEMNCWLSQCLISIRLEFGPNSLNSVNSLHHFAFFAGPCYLFPRFF